jgi:hypothetical protein
VTAPHDRRVLGRAVPDLARPQRLQHVVGRLGVVAGLHRVDRGVEAAEAALAEVEHHVDHDHLARLVEPVVRRTHVALRARDRLGHVLLEPLGDLLGADLLAHVVAAGREQVADTGGREPARVEVHVVAIALVLGDERLQRGQVHTGRAGRALGHRLGRVLAPRTAAATPRELLDLRALSRRRIRLGVCRVAVRRTVVMGPLEAHGASPRSP